MASDGRYRSRRMVDRIAAARQTNDRLCMLQFEQPVVGDLGSIFRGICVDRLADLPFPHEPSRAQEKREGEGKRAISRMTAASEIALFGVQRAAKTAKEIGMRISVSTVKLPFPFTKDNPELNHSFLAKVHQEIFDHSFTP